MHNRKKSVKLRAGNLKRSAKFTKLYLDLLRKKKSIQINSITN